MHRQNTTTKYTIVAEFADEIVMQSRQPFIAVNQSRIQDQGVQRARIIFFAKHKWCPLINDFGLNLPKKSEIPSLIFLQSWIRHWKSVSFSLTLTKGMWASSAARPDVVVKVVKSSRHSCCTMFEVLHWMPSGVTVLELDPQIPSVLSSVGRITGVLGRLLLRFLRLPDGGR